MRRFGLLLVGLLVLVSIAVAPGDAEATRTSALPVGRIAYAEKGICVVSADGRARRCYLAGPLVADIYDSPAWSHDGRQIAFQDLVDCSVPGCLDGVFVVNADGSNLRRIARAHGVSDEAPAWSPRGSKIVFARWSYADGYSGIYVADVDRARVRRLYQRLTGYRLLAPSWSPDGRKIAFSDDGGHLYLMNADGSHVREVQFGGKDSRWSPNGRKLLVSRSGDLYVINADGTRPRRIARDAWDGAWSPNGRQIAFTCAGPQPGGMGICLVNADGSGRLRLCYEYVANDVTPAWSPDGAWISYVRYALRADGSTMPSIMVLNLDSGEARQVTTPVSVNGTPVWQPRPR